MDFFGFHPLYVVILVALALIIFGPSRLPKMGAQMGRMLREFQAAREGLTQQMREAFEEEPENNYGGSTASEEPEAASEESSVAVLDPPPGGQTTPEALGTAENGAGDGPWEGFTPTTPDVPAEGTTAEEPETAAALHTPETPEPVSDAPAERVTAEEPETAATLSSPAEDVTAGGLEAPAPTPPGRTVEEPETAANLEAPAEEVAAAEPGEAEVKGEAADVPGSDSVAPPVVAGETGAESSREAGNPFAWVAPDHQSTEATRDEGTPRP